MIEEIEELCIKAQGHVLGHGKPLGEIKIVPEETWSAKLVSSAAPELTSGSSVATVASAGAWIDYRYKGVGIKPLNRAGLSHTQIAVTTIGIHARYQARELGAAALYDSAAIRRIGRAENRKRNSAVPEHGPGNLPTVGDVAERMVVHLQRKVINVLRRKVVADVVVAIAVVARQFAWQRRQNSARRELEKAAV